MSDLDRFYTENESIRLQCPPKGVIMSAINRSVTSVFVAGIAAAAFASSGFASAETVTVHSRGTGQEMPKRVITETENGTRIENPYKAEIFPLPGQITPYNHSVEGGDRLGADLALRYSHPGDTIEFDGYSQGGIVAGDNAERLYLLGVSKDRAIVVRTESDGRLRGTGITVVFKRFTDMLPGKGYPFVQFDGERQTQGQIQSYNECKLYDIICGAENPFINPGGFVAGALGYGVYGHHGYVDAAKYPSRVVTYDGGYTVVTVIDAGNPLIKLGDQVSTVVTGKPLSDAQEDLVGALSPATTPGSRQQVAPDPVAVSEAAGEVASEAYVEYAPQVVNTAVDAGVTQVTGNAVVGDIAGDVAEQVATPIVKETAPIVQQGVEAATRSVMTGDPSVFNGFVNGLVPNANLPVR